MGVAENPNKVKNIVSKNRDHFRELYKPFIKNFSHIVKYDANRNQYHVLNQYR
jgi:hypothetical protein